jgi:hypothetical protein
MFVELPERIVLAHLGLILRGVSSHKASSAAEGSLASLEHDIGSAAQPTTQVQGAANCHPSTST